MDSHRPAPSFGSPGWHPVGLPRTLHMPRLHFTGLDSTLLMGTFTTHDIGGCCLPLGVPLGGHPLRVFRQHREWAEQGPSGFGTPLHFLAEQTPTRGSCAGQRGLARSFCTNALTAASAPQGPQRPSMPAAANCIKNTSVQRNASIEEFAWFIMTGCEGRRTPAGRRHSCEPGVGGVVSGTQ